MSTCIQLANTDVEFEYAHPSIFSIKQSWSRHPLCLQLQYLPLLYANGSDLVAVTEYPDESFLHGLMQTGWWPEGLPQMILLDNNNGPKGLECESWGPSRQVQAWAVEKGVRYFMPSDWDTVCLINSKAFSFRFTTLSGAALLTNEQHLLQWMATTKGPKVIKTCYGLSGLGNKRTDQTEATPDLLAFCEKEWARQRPLIGEPWLNRILDFSSQWKIRPDKHIEWIGATLFETDPQGIYQGTLAGPESLLFGASQNYLQQHRQYVQKVLEEICSLGFFGNIGFDAFLYRHPENGSICLNPLVEINGRKTMSLVALLLQKRACPDHVLKFSFQKSQLDFPTLLPNHCKDDKGKRIFFHRRLTANINS